MGIPLRIDATTIPALAFGGLLIVVALILGFFVWKTRRLLEPAVESDQVARLHADRQFRRRMQVGVMLFATGVLIPLGDQLDKLFLQKPLLFFVWIGGVLGLVFWMVLMAVMFAAFCPALCRTIQLAPGLLKLFAANLYI